MDRRARLEQRLGQELLSRLIAVASEIAITETGNFAFYVDPARFVGLSPSRNVALGREQRMEAICIIDADGNVIAIQRESLYENMSVRGGGEVFRIPNGYASTEGRGRRIEGGEGGVDEGYNDDCGDTAGDDDRGEDDDEANRSRRRHASTVEAGTQTIVADIDCNSTGEEELARSLASGEEDEAVDTGDSTGQCNRKTCCGCLCCGCFCCWVWSIIIFGVIFSNIFTGNTDM